MSCELLDIDHIHVFVSDREAAVQWYEHALSLTPIRELEFWAKDGGPLTITNEKRSITIALFEAEAASCRSTIAIRVNAPGFLAWREHLDSVLDNRVRLEDHQVAWSIYFADPDNNPFEIISYAYGELSDSLHESSPTIRSS